MSSFEKILTKVQKFFVKFETFKARLESQRPEPGRFRAVSVPAVSLLFLQARIALANGLDLVNVLKGIVFETRVRVSGSRKGLVLLLLLLLFLLLLMLLILCARFDQHSLKMEKYFYCLMQEYLENSYYPVCWHTTKKMCSEQVNIVYTILNCFDESGL